MQYEMCMGTFPFTAKNEGALIRKILKGQYKDPTGYSAELLNVIKLCLLYDATKRPSASMLLARPEMVRQSKIAASQCELDQDNKLNTLPAQQPLGQHKITEEKDDAQDWKTGENVVRQQRNQQPQRHPFALDDVNCAKATTVRAKTCHQPFLPRTRKGSSWKHVGSASNQGICEPACSIRCQATWAVVR